MERRMEQSPCGYGRNSRPFCLPGVLPGTSFRNNVRLFNFASSTYSSCNTSVYVDKIRTGFINWTPRIKGYKQATGDGSPINWGVDTTPFLQVIKTTITTSDYFNKLALLWGQEPSKTGSTVELRSENVLYIKSLGTVFPTQDDGTLLIFQ